jgi:hypothetical protein
MNQAPCLFVLFANLTDLHSGSYQFSLDSVYFAKTMQSQQRTHSERILASLRRKYAGGDFHRRFGNFLFTFKATQKKIRAAQEISGGPNREVTCGGRAFPCVFFTSFQRLDL